MLVAYEVLLVLGNISSAMHCMLCCSAVLLGGDTWDWSASTEAYKVDALRFSNNQHIEAWLRCNVQASEAYLGNAGTQGDAGNVLGSPPVAVPDPSTPAAAPPGHTVGSLGTGADLGTPDQPGPAEEPQAKEPSNQPAVNLELLRDQHQLEQVQQPYILPGSMLDSLRHRPQMCGPL